uniref:Uncharacterized protein MANES_13G037700 n=1 Tax=Rhizophora mucronata TaxID=61149 RepID=A0A2P2K665_RHIMU
MNTKTMRLPPRRVVTSNKRKERDGFDLLKPSTPQPQVQPHPPPVLQPPAAKSLKPTPPLVGSEKLPETASNNRLLAGYLAHEYLTRGTLFAQPWDPARADAVPVSDAEYSKTVQPSQKAEADCSGKAEPNNENYQRYVEVSGLLKTDGAHIPGIVNPTQLRFFLQTGKQ